MWRAIRQRWSTGLRARRLQKQQLHQLAQQGRWQDR